MTVPAGATSVIRKHNVLGHKYVAWGPFEVKHLTVDELKSAVKKRYPKISNHLVFKRFDEGHISMTITLDGVETRDGYNSIGLCKFVPKMTDKPKDFINLYIDSRASMKYALDNINKHINNYYDRGERYFQS